MSKEVDAALNSSSTDPAINPAASTILINSSKRNSSQNYI